MFGDFLKEIVLERYLIYSFITLAILGLTILHSKIKKKYERDNKTKTYVATSLEYAFHIFWFLFFITTISFFKSSPFDQKIAITLIFFITLIYLNYRNYYLLTIGFGYLSLIFKIIALPNKCREKFQKTVILFSLIKNESQANICLNKNFIKTKIAEANAIYKEKQNNKAHAPKTKHPYIETSHRLLRFRFKTLTLLFLLILSLGFKSLLVQTSETTLSYIIVALSGFLWFFFLKTIYDSISFHVFLTNLSSRIEKWINAIDSYFKENPILVSLLKMTSTFILGLLFRRYEESYIQKKIKNFFLKTDYNFKYVLVFLRLIPLVSFFSYLIFAFLSFTLIISNLHKAISLTHVLEKQPERGFFIQYFYLFMGESGSPFLYKSAPLINSSFYTLDCSIIICGWIMLGLFLTLLSTSFSISIADLEIALEKFYSHYGTKINSFINEAQAKGKHYTKETLLASFSKQFSQMEKFKEEIHGKTLKDLEEKVAEAAEKAEEIILAPQKKKKPPTTPSRKTLKRRQKRARPK